ncbi:MAG: transcriptional regulator, partial [Desulfobacula sp.]|nr:transcriptional regulator [Desulfobacula sp.]
MKKADTKLQILLILLSVMAVLSSFIGGYLYYTSLTRYSLEQVHKDAAEQLKGIGNDIDSYLNWSLFSVKSLAGLKELNQSLLNGDANIPETNAVLKQFRNDLKVSVCYLMDRSGKTIASSNVDAANSFVGKNYGFRPYFIQAMEGKPGLYMGVGVTSKQRGIYYSHPVYAKGEETPSGVAVIKAPIEPIEKNFQ